MSANAKRVFAQSAKPEAKQKAAYPSPVTLRLHDCERDKLEDAAGDLTISAYIRLCLFGDNAPKHRTRGKKPVKDHQAPGQLLGMLGRSNVPNNLNQLTKAANSGTIALTEDVEAQIKQAAFEIASMRLLLMKALGTKDGRS